MTATVGWFALRGATLALAWFCLLNIVASITVALAARPLIASGRPRTAAFWFGLRMFGAVGALAFVSAIFLPSYWLYEPRDVSEGFDLFLTVGAAAAILAVVAGAVRGASAWLSASRRTRAWMQNARPLALAGTNIPAFEIDAAAPVLALVGVLRPRLLVTRGLIATLTPEELAASVAHEMGHSRAWDNLTRLAMRSVPDVLPPAAAMRGLERRWAASSEHRADQAAGDHPGIRCALASALVKVARLTPPAPPLAEPISTLVGGGDIASRVRRLLDDRTAVSAGVVTSAARWTAYGALAVMMLLAYAPLLRGVHEATEILVRSLP
jgi:Zn-dependent protease with chaperone function